MEKRRNWLQIHKFEAHTIVFLGMILSSLGLYISFLANLSTLTILLLIVFALCNFFALWIK